MASISPKTSILGYDNAFHLLRRATYCPNNELITAFSLKTPQEALNDLFNFINPVPVEPIASDGINFYIASFLNPSLPPAAPGGDKGDSFNLWFYDNLRTHPTLHYKLTLWLHSIFIAAASVPIEDFFDYIQLLRYYSKGSIKEFAKKITVNGDMGFYLSNDSNSKYSPNQNYGREFLELFTILKGEQAGPGDYTNYLEADVVQAARVLTGFKGLSYSQTTRVERIDPITKIPTGKAFLNDHDTGNKTFSSKFNNTVIVGALTENDMWRELSDFVNMVFSQIETAKAYSRSLYRYFVSRNISAEIEADIINPLANTLFNNNFNIEIAVKQLLTSTHFYDEDDSISGDEVVGSLIKSPLDLFFQTMNLLELEFPNANFSSRYFFYFHFTQNILSQCGFPLFNPVNVSGYPGHSSSPDFDKNWLTTTTLRNRYNLFIDSFLDGIYTGTWYKLNLPLFVKNSSHFTNPSNATILLDEFLNLLLVSRPVSNRYAYFQNALLGDLTAINWSFEWQNYVGNVQNGVEIALKRLVAAIVKSPEYQLF